MAVHGVRKLVHFSLAYFAPSCLSKPITLAFNLNSIITVCCCSSDVFFHVDAHATASKEEGRGEDGLTLQQRLDNDSREFWKTLSGVVPDHTVSTGFVLHAEMHSNYVERHACRCACGISWRPHCRNTILNGYTIQSCAVRTQSQKWVRTLLWASFVRRLHSATATKNTSWEYDAIMNGHVYFDREHTAPVSRPLEHQSAPRRPKMSTALSPHRLLRWSSKLSALR